MANVVVAMYRSADTISGANVGVAAMLHGNEWPSIQTSAVTLQLEFV